MAKETANEQPEKPALGPLSSGNLTQHIQRIEQRDSRKDEPAPDATKGAAEASSPGATAAPVVAQDPDFDWAADGLQVDHKMLRGKKPDEVVEMFRSAQKKIREQGTALNARTAAPPSNTEQVTAASDGADPREAEYDLVQYTDPARARAIMREWAREEASRELTTKEQARADQERLGSYASAGQSFAEKLTTSRGLDLASAQKRIVKHVIPEMHDDAAQVYADHGGDDNREVATAAWHAFWKDPANYENAYNRVYGAPSAAPVPVPSVTQRAEPPGSKAPAPIVAGKVTTDAPISKERDFALRQLARSAKVSEDKFVQRASARR